jgi:pectate lyase
MNPDPRSLRATAALLPLALALPMLLAAPAGAQPVAAGARHVVEVEGNLVVARATPQGAWSALVPRGLRYVVSDTQAGWVRLDFAGRAVWVAASDVRRVSSGVAAVEVAGLSAVRSNASPRGVLLGQAAGGQSYVELARQPGWVQVQFDARAGWIPETSSRALSWSGGSAAPTPGSAASPPVTTAARTATASSGRYPRPAADLLAEREGFGASARGGDPQRIFRVTTRSNRGSGSLRTALESSQPYWIVFDVEGTFDLGSSPVRIRTRKTIDGRARDVTIRGGLRIERARDVIVADVRLTNPRGDAILVNGEGGSRTSDFESRDLWFHHLELFSSGDGLIDVRGGTNITISWCHFHTHLKGLLIWKDSRQRAAPGMRVTMHHNYFDRLTRRGPNFNYGRIDYYNNYQDRWYEYGAGSHEGAQFLSEANVYQARRGWLDFSGDPNPGGDHDWIVSKKAIVNDWAGRRQGAVRSVNDLARNGAEIVTHRASTVFQRPYRVQVERAGDALVQRIVNGAGPR